MHLAVQKLHWKPREWFELTEEERAFTIASFDVKFEDDKKAQKKAEDKSKGGSSGLNLSCNPKTNARW